MIISGCFLLDSRCSKVFLLSLGEEPTDHSIENTQMTVIWARGQEPQSYVHKPKSGLEAGSASVRDFYRPDELKYHGHGSQRGGLSLNFFGSPTSSISFVKNGSSRPVISLSPLHFLAPVAFVLLARVLS